MTLPIHLCERIFAGEPPVSLWAEHRDMDVSALRKATAIKSERLFQLLEGRGRKMSSEEEKLLARALQISRADLRPMSFVGCAGLDVDEEEVLRHAGEL